MQSRKEIANFIVSNLYVVTICVSFMKRSCRHFFNLFTIRKNCSMLLSLSCCHCRFGKPEETRIIVSCSQFPVSEGIRKRRTPLSSHLSQKTRPRL